MAKTSQTPRSVFSRLDRSRVSALQHALDHSFVQLLAFAAFIVAVVVLVTFDFDARSSRLAELEVGQLARSDVTSPRSFTFIQTDESASAKRRDEAASEVPVVYDWQEGMGETVRNRVTTAFQDMRKAMSTSVREGLAKTAPERLAILEAQEGDVQDALIELLTPQQRTNMARELRKDTFDATLGVSIRDSDFEAFARDGFSSIAESELADIAGQVMTNIIVPSQRVVEAEQDRGIFLRRMRGEKVLIEYHVQDLDGRFLTMERVPAVVEEAGARRLSTIGDKELREAIVSTATALAQPNTFSNPQMTLEKRQAARQGVEDQVTREDVRKGQVIVARGDSLTERHLRLVDAMMQEEDVLSGSQLFAGVVLFCLLFLATLYIFGRRNIRKFRPDRKDIVFMAISMLLMLLMTRAGDLFGHALGTQFGSIPVEAWYYAIPVAAGGMLVRLILNSEHAVVFTILFAVLVGIMAGNSLFFMSYAAIGGLVGAGSVRQVKNRMTLMWSGLFVGGINAIAICAFLLIQGDFLHFSTLLYMFLGFLGGIASGLIVSAVLPIFEAVFGYTTDIKLLELANLNHPALRELIMRAPGSYHHSMMVGSLCEAAAEAIGCNPLLARVGAYYHDIGKGKNPQYFAENQELGHNPHDKLKPNMSALVIKAHVKDGVELARQHRLPEVMEDFIAQHHGTSLIAYFYHKAKQLEDPDIPEVDEKDYRYPGPKPQSRETAICLLADGVEAASRAMPDPTHARLKGLVQKMINKAFTDGQLDECELTLKDLNAIAEAFNRILAGIYHHRPEYPTDKKKEVEKKKETEKKRETGKNPAVQKTSDGQKPRRTSRLTPASLQGAQTSDVWKLTEERKQQEDDDADRHDGEPDSSEPSDSQKDGRDDADEGRDSLPRLGSK